MIILANTKILRNETNKCEGYIEDLESNTNDIEKTIADIGNIWKKKEYSNFLTKMNDFMSELDNFKKQIESFNEFVKGYVKTEEIVDTQYLNKELNIE